MIEILVMIGGFYLYYRFFKFLKNTISTGWDLIKKFRKYEKTPDESEI